MKLFFSNHLTKNIQGLNTSHLLLNKVLQEYYAMPAATAVCRPENGKPYWEGTGRPCFSVSHTGTLWLCAVTDHEIGMDAELLARPVVQPVKLAERYFSEEESDYIRCGPSINKTDNTPEDTSIQPFQWERILPGKNTENWTAAERLLLIWTRKEALLKYYGRGLGSLTKTRSVMEEPEGLSIRSYRNKGILLSLCAEASFQKEAITEYIDLDNGKVHRNVRFYRRKNPGKRFADS